MARVGKMRIFEKQIRIKYQYIHVHGVYTGTFPYVTNTDQQNRHFFNSNFNKKSWASCIEPETTAATITLDMHLNCERCMSCNQQASYEHTCAHNPKRDAAHYSSVSSPSIRLSITSSSALCSSVLSFPLMNTNLPPRSRPSLLLHLG